MAAARTVRVGVVQASPVFLDRDGSTKRATEYVAEAGTRGVELLAFPEGFIPAHPIWYHFHPATGRESLQMAAELFENAVEVPGPTTDALCAAAAAAGTAVVTGVCERRSAATGTLLNSQLFIERDGSLVGKHQKLTPTVGERLVHAGGYGDTADIDLTGCTRAKTVHGYAGHYNRADVFSLTVRRDIPQLVVEVGTSSGPTDTNL